MNRRLAASAAALLLVLTGCGDDDDDTASQAPEVADGNFKGSFAKVAGAPKGTKKIAGSATMTVEDSGTSLALSVTGLNPKAAYIAHVHNDVCSAADPGGAHFKYDPAGGDLPPNELHIAVDVSKAGKGTGATSNPAEAGPSAKSVVIHLKKAAGAKKAETTPPKLACADFSAA